MRKLLSFVLLLAVLGMAACERKQEAPQQTQAPVEATPAPPVKKEQAVDPVVPPKADPRQAKIEAKVRQLVADQLKIPTDRVVSEAQLQRDLGADDLDFIELVMAMEEEFNVTITDEYAGKIKTVGDAVKILIWLGAR